MNKKQKLVSTTLSTVTALSSVGAISSLPNNVITNVQALDENTVETTQQVQPTIRTDLEKEVEDKNSTVISTGLLELHYREQRIRRTVQRKH